MTRRKKFYWPVAWMSGVVMGGLAVYWTPKAVDRFMMDAGPPPAGVSSDTYRVNDGTTANTDDIDASLSELHRKGAEFEARQAIVGQKPKYVDDVDYRALREAKRQKQALQDRIARGIKLLEQGGTAAAVEEVLRGEE